VGRNGSFHFNKDKSHSNGISVDCKSVSVSVSNNYSIIVYLPHGRIDFIHSFFP